MTHTDGYTHFLWKSHACPVSFNEGLVELAPQRWGCTFSCQCQSFQGGLHGCAPVLPQGSSGGTDCGVPLLRRLFLHPSLPSCLWNPPTASKSQQCWHFGGKYKKPSSGHLGGADLALKCEYFYCFLDFMPF